MDIIRSIIWMKMKKNLILIQESSKFNSIIDEFTICYKFIKIYELVYLSICSALLYMALLSKPHINWYHK